MLFICRSVFVQIFETAVNVAAYAITLLKFENNLEPLHKTLVSVMIIPASLLEFLKLGSHLVGCHLLASYVAHILQPELIAIFSSKGND